MQLKEKFYPESRFGGFTDIDGNVVFFNRVNCLLTPEAVVLDVGCGRGAGRDDPIPLSRDLRMIRGKVKKVIGIDVDDAARENSLIDEFRKIPGATWPVEPNTVDLILCDNVIEHIEDPNKFFSEARRVLMKDGYLCIRTPNAWSYVALCAKLVPNKYHSKVLHVAQNSRRDEDVFPTLYRCNSVSSIKRMMEKFGFESVVYGYEAEPSYLSFSRAAYWLGVLHQRFAPKILKPALFAFGKLKKKDAD